MGKREPGDSHSMASASSHRSDPGRKPARFFSLRRVIQDMQQQRITSSRKRRSAPADTDPRGTSLAASSADAGGWHMPRLPVGDMMAGSTIVGALDEEAEIGVAHCEDVSESMDCVLCALKQPVSDFMRVTSSCSHRVCKDCLRRYLSIEIMESRVNVECPACPERLHPNDVRRILGTNSRELIAKYEEFTLRRLLVHDPDARWCPAPDCGYVVIAAGCASCPKLTCERPGCGTLFCYHCKQKWHPNQTCDAARAERASNVRTSFTCSQDSNSPNEIKPCPRCGAFIVKMDDGSCNHMTCAICGAEFCWLCMKEISDLHYLSPSGCTFWGKKPWSRKKKILWQLGTMVGAPIGISLIAAIAVPAIIIGVPIWVGRKLHARFSSMTKHKRNSIVAGGVVTSIIISPLLAAAAVGIGVPILLSYVYCVVPISLCRSGGCGVSTTNSGGVRIDFDESDVPAGTGPGAFVAGDTRSVIETDGHHGINPSIGPSIGEMSVGLTNSLSASGSHLDRVGVIREDCTSDRDSASHQAIAGSCINASLSGSLLAGPSGFQNRLEVQAEVTTNHIQLQKRASLSSESANFSIDAKSVTVSFGDNMSVIALAGSICNRDKDNSSAVVSITDVASMNEPLPCPPPVPASAAVSCSPAVYVVSAPNDELSIPPRASFHRYGSPPSSLRSVSFIHGDVSTAADGRTALPSRPSYKRQGVSVTDSIDECVEGALSSLTPPDVMTLMSTVLGDSVSGAATDCSDIVSSSERGVLPDVESCSSHLDDYHLLPIELCTSGTTDCSRGNGTVCENGGERNKYFAL